MKSRAAGACPISGETSNRFKAWAWAWALALLPVLALAQFNDTGQSQCASGAGMTACTAATAGQDGSRGRDAQATAGQLAKAGAGAAGFDFTALDGLGMPAAPGAHDCVADNVTGLVWSAQTLAAQNWAGASAATEATRCGITGWRLPTRRELLSIVHHGASGPPAIDGTYFPATASAPYWSADAAAGRQAWAVDFGDGATLRADAAQPYAVRPVTRPVNHAPTITLGPDIVVPREDRPGPLTYPAWATGISPGPGREAWQQQLSATVEVLPRQDGDPKQLEFDEKPAIDLATGHLTFTIKHRIYPDDNPDHPSPAWDNWYSSAGLARVRVTLRDDGGTADGGQDTTSKEFTIFLDPVPVAYDVFIKTPWKSSIPVTFLTMDADSDGGGGYPFGVSPWPWPTMRVLTMPKSGFLTDVVASRAPDGDERWMVRFASQGRAIEYAPSRSATEGMVKTSTQAAAASRATVTAQSVSTWDVTANGTHAPDRGTPPYNFVASVFYVPFSTTFTGSDSFTYDVIDPDGNVSNTVSVSIEISEN